MEYHCIWNCYVDNFWQSHYEAIMSEFILTMIILAGFFAWLNAEGKAQDYQDQNLGVREDIDE